MRKSALLLSAFALLCFTSVAAAAESSAARRPIPVILQTDIGSDIDDTWAVAQLLRSPELDLKLVLVDTGDVRYRAKLVAKLLDIAGRNDIPIALGASTPMTEQDQHQGPWVRGYDLSKYKGGVIEDGAAAVIKLVNESPAPITVIAVGPVPGLAQAVKRDPSFASKARLVGMHGSFDVGYDGGPVSIEYNVKLDPGALSTVLAAPWKDVLLTPLDTCGFVDLRGPNYFAVWSETDDAVLRAVIENYCIFAPRASWLSGEPFFTTRSTTLFDCVAVYLAYAEDLVEVESLRCKVTDDGYTRRDPAGSPARVAIRWKNRERFENHLTERLLSATVSDKR